MSEARQTVHLCIIEGHVTFFDGITNASEWVYQIYVTTDLRKEIFRKRSDISKQLVVQHPSYSLFALQNADLKR